MVWGEAYTCRDMLAQANSEGGKTAIVTTWPTDAIDATGE